MRMRVGERARDVAEDAHTVADRQRTLDAARTSTRERYLPLLPAAPAEVKPINAPWVP